MDNNKALILKEENKPVLIQVSDALFKSGLYPNIKNSYGAFAIVQYGSELGIGPMTSLQTMAIIQGKVCMGAQMMLSLAMKSGVTMKITKDTDTECHIHFQRGALEYDSSFSIDEAKKAGIYRDQSGWTKYPRDMLYWRAVTRGLRRVCPDVITGLYAIEEIQDAPPLNAPEPKLPEDEGQTDVKDMEAIAKESQEKFVKYHDRLMNIQNIFELENWGKKHKEELKADLMPEHLEMVRQLYSKLKEKFDANQGGNV